LFCIRKIGNIQRKAICKTEFIAKEFLIIRIVETSRSLPEMEGPPPLRKPLKVV
jgi:hypothetical protein